MKNIHLLIFLVIISACGGGGSSNSQETDSTNPPNINLITESCSPSWWNSSLDKCELIHDSLERYYYIYVPTNIDINKSIPLLFALHGYGSTARNHFSYTNYQSLADANNFVIVFPQGYAMNTALASSSSHWNVGGWTIGSNVNDIDFIDSVIELVSNKVQIDETRIYSSGMSNGGFMSYHLACNLSTKIAAIASVTGSMTPETYSSCSPNHPTPILQIHGLRDAVVPYNGLSYIESIPKVMQYWSEYNSCDLEPEILVVDNFDDDYSVNFETYINCLNNINIKLILHSAMGHTWPMTNNYGVSASNEIWDFVSQYDIYGKIN